MNFIDTADSLPEATLRLDNTINVQEVTGDVQAAAAIALHFPKWTDGRAYSQARLIRSRLRYTGPLIATGEVLVDMLPLLQRSGFDAVQLRAGQDRTVAERALGFFPGHYQADLVSKLPLYQRTAG